MNETKIEHLHQDYKLCTLLLSHIMVTFLITVVKQLKENCIPKEHSLQCSGGGLCLVGNIKYSTLPEFTMVPPTLEVKVQDFVPIFSPTLTHSLLLTFNPARPEISGICLAVRST